MSRRVDIKRWYARAKPLTGNGEMLAAVDADALVDDVGWLLARVETLQHLLSSARCPNCDGSGGYFTGGCDVPGEAVQCQWCDERREAYECQTCGDRRGYYILERDNAGRKLQHVFEPCADCTPEVPNG